MLLILLFVLTVTAVASPFPENSDVATKLAEGAVNATATHKAANRVFL